VPMACRWVAPYAGYGPSRSTSVGVTQSRIGPTRITAQLRMLAPARTALTCRVPSRSARASASPLQAAHRRRIRDGLEYGESYSSSPATSFTTGLNAVYLS
jgi:hypothetical protein